MNPFIYLWYKNKPITFREGTPLNDEIATRQNMEFTSVTLLPDPDEVLRKNGTDVKIYSDLFIDSHLSSVWEQRTAGTISHENRFVQGQSSEAKLQFLEEQTKDWDWDSLIYEILLSRYYGYSVFEKTWVRDGRFIYLDEITSKPRQWFGFNRWNECVLKDRNRYDGIVIEPMQFTLVQNRPTYLNPYGDRLASKVFWNVTFKRGGVKFWVKFIEKYGMPFIAGKTDVTDNAKKQEILNKLISMAQDAVAVIPKGTDIDIFPDATNSKSGDNYQKLAEFCDKQISKAILTQTLTTEQGNVGSQALGNVHLDQFSNIVESDKRFVMRTLNKLFTEILSYNFTDEENPYWELYTEDELTKEDVEKDDLLSRHLTFSKDYWANKYGIDEKDFEVKQSSEFSEPPNQDQIDKLADVILTDSKSLNKTMEQTIKPILDLIEKSESFQEIQAGLSEMYPKLNTKELEKILVKSMLIAEHLGIESNQDE